METVAKTPKYNLNEEQERKLILREYRALMRSLKAKIKPGDKDLLRTAFEIAVDAHKTMRRKSGEPYILHPLLSRSLHRKSLVLIQEIIVSKSSWKNL